MMESKLTRATVPEKQPQCPVEGCRKTFQHKQSLQRHLRSRHPDYQQSGFVDFGDPAFRSLMQYMEEAGPITLLPVDAADGKKSACLPADPDTAVPSASATDQSAGGCRATSTSYAADVNGGARATTVDLEFSPVTMDEDDDPENDDVEPWKAAKPAAVAPRKDIPHAASSLLDRAAEQWLRTPDVSAEAVITMVTELPTQSPFSIAAAAQRRFGMSTAARTSLRRRLSAATAMERRMIQEVRNILPIGDLDGNSALTTVRRLEFWLRSRGQRPPARVHE